MSEKEKEEKDQLEVYLEMNRIVKRPSKTGEYTDIYDVNCPVTFFFVGEEFDGIEIDVKGVSESEMKLAQEICLKLAPVLNKQKTKKN